MAWGIETEFWLIITAAAGLATWLAYRGFIGRSGQGRPRCPKCWYDMTGAPSLTCPECGHTPESQRPQFNRRRSRRAVVLLVLVMLLILYFVYPVRRRMVGGESIGNAAIPTTALIGLSAFDVQPGLYDLLASRFFPAGHDGLDVPDWQASLEAYAMHHRILTFESVNPKRRDGFSLQRLSQFSPTALRLWAQLMSEHPDANARQMIAQIIVNPYNSFEGPSTYRTPVTRALLLKAIDEKKVHFTFFNMALDAFGPEQLGSLSDDEIIHELPMLANVREETSIDMYMRELLRRHLAAAVPALKTIPMIRTPTQQVLIQNTISRLMGEKDAVRVRLIPHEDLPDFFRIELSLTTLAELEFASPKRPASIFFYISVIPISGGPEKAWGSQSVDVTVLKKDQPILLLVHPDNLPTHCRVRVRAFFQPYRDLSKVLNPPAGYVEILPVSKDLEMTQPAEINP